MRWRAVSAACELAPRSKSLGDAENNCVETTATLPVEYYRLGTDY
jgi:hypothetical protein